MPKLSTLVQKIKRRISKHENWFHGATITPVFYTFSWKYASGVISGKDAFQMLNMFRYLITPKEYRKAKANIENTDFTEEIYVRGLTEEERSLKSCLTSNNSFPSLFVFRIPLKRKAFLGTEKLGFRVFVQSRITKYMQREANTRTNAGGQPFSQYSPSAQSIHGNAPCTLQSFSLT